VLLIAADVGSDAPNQREKSRVGCAVGALDLRLGDAQREWIELGAVELGRQRRGGGISARLNLTQDVRNDRRHIERLLLDRFPDEIEHIWTRTGTAAVATDPMGLEVSDVFVTLTPRDAGKRAGTQDELVQAMSTTLEGMPGMRSVFTQPIELRVNEMLAGIRSDVGI